MAVDAEALSAIATGTPLRKCGNVVVFVGWDTKGERILPRSESGAGGTSREDNTVRILLFALSLTFIGSIGCRQGEGPRLTPTFKEDLEFLQSHTEVIVLKDLSAHAQVAVVPAWQGRVMTSTNGGTNGPSFGWINYELIASGEIQPHINPFGGEDRFWMGPEGGQFSIFFEQGDPFDLEHWQTPACLDTQPFETTARNRNAVSFQRQIDLVNYSGSSFQIQIDRTVELLSEATAYQSLNIPEVSELDIVAFASENSITNIGPTEWRKDSGLLSIWILGMYVPSLTTTVVLPFRQGSQEELGPVVNDAYFGKVPSERLQIEEGVLYFKADGKYRSKIGLSSHRAYAVAGSFDSSRELLTLVQYNKPEGVTDYVNSMWEIQENPYAGDVINSYNDGPPAPGVKPLGPFYELETSSPAALLKPGETMTHIHRTYHLTGPRRQVDEIARKVLGAGIREISD